MQQDIVSGRLLCSKEEAATLAAVQLRLESWPEENHDLAEGFSFFSFCFRFERSFSFSEDKMHRLHLTLNEPTIFSSSDRTRWNFPLSTIICCQQLDSTTHRAKKPFLPPNLRHSNEIFKLIKVS